MDEKELSVPLHIQRVERALNLDPLLDYVDNVINQPLR